MYILWVDDILTISATTTRIDKMYDLLKSKYQVQQMGDLTKYLGIHIIRDTVNGTLYLSQRDYIRLVLQRFHMENCVALLAPSTDTITLRINSVVATEETCHLYQALLGSLMYLSVWTRPDISERCSKLGQFAINPSPEHLKIVLEMCLPTYRAPLI